MEGLKRGQPRLRVLACGGLASVMIAREGELLLRCGPGGLGQRLLLDRRSQPLVPLAFGLHELITEADGLILVARQLDSGARQLALELLGRDLDLRAGGVGGGGSLDQRR